jgi:hypothetical protein
VPDALDASGVVAAIRRCPETTAAVRALHPSGELGFPDRHSSNSARLAGGLLIRLGVWWASDRSATACDCSRLNAVASSWRLFVIADLGLRGAGAMRQS